ncbi:hypothetical protein [Pseudomonas sp. NPDC089396]|uniref:hypothetical protein n=1 Tax=Pseudomonas sp. NPDC089396 TaxID=3364461 RepID=UPI00383832DA
MNTPDRYQDHYRPSDDVQSPAGKITRFLALGDKPGHPTGFFVLLSDGDMLLSAAHPHSTFIFHNNGGMSHGG